MKHPRSILCLFAFLFSACTSEATPIETLVIVQTSTPAIPQEIVVSEGLQILNVVPETLRTRLEGLSIPPGSNVVVDLDAANRDMSSRIDWVYVLVAPFPTVADDVSIETLRSAWNGNPLPSSFGQAPLLMVESTLGVFKAFWGEPAAGAVKIVQDDQLLETAWGMSPSWAIVPFESLTPQWKVLTVDGRSPIRKGFDPESYPLSIPYKLTSSFEIDDPSIHSSNYAPSKLTTIIMTGVTALVRATAVTMELKGSMYPGEKIREIFREADIVHVSNEIPFFTGCPFPKPQAGALVFCSDPKYMDLITDIGTDVIELTGNHFADYGPYAMYETLDIYRANNIPYFGGGEDLQDSLKPALFDINGNKIAFIGCNKPDVGNFPTATDYQPGAAPCDFDYLRNEIAFLKSEGYVVISTFQWNESYDSKPSPQQIRDFRLMADSGASIVSGSQAHYAQMMEFYDDAFIHYGLGNLFFDQMGDQDWMPPGIRREFFDRYVIYNGKLISVELLTAMLEDYSRPRMMTPEERAGFLQEYFYYSGWSSLNPTLTPAITPTLTPMTVPPLAVTPSP